MSVQQPPALTLFLESLKSKHTQRTYLYHLNRFLEETKLDMGGLLSMDQKSIEGVLIQYLIAMKGRDTASLTRQLTLAAIVSFLSANDVDINKKRVSRYLGEHSRQSRTGPTRGRK
jgi:hypothetical protein